MIDLDGQLEAYLITNGRSTLPYCERALKAQEGVLFKTVYHRDLDWLEANRKILRDCKTRFFLRVDDDMILHPRAVSYMWHIASGQPADIALRGFRLWEPYSDKVCKGIKIYDTQQARRVGFRINEIGKIDKPFTKDAEQKNLRIQYEEDVVGIHACSSIDEHIRYAQMRGEDRGKDFAKEESWMREKIGSYRGTLDDQYALAGGFLRKLNVRLKTGFGAYLRKL
jgi:hypothetical protein